MKKSIFLFFAAILCAMTANAYNQAAKDLYFDNSEAKWEKCYVYIGKGDYTSCYDMTRVPGTQYLWQLPANFNGGSAWNSATGWVVCKEKWWASSNETIDKYIWHGDNNVTKKSTAAWVETKIYTTNGAANATSDGTTKKVYTVTSYDKSNYTVTINTVEGGTLTVKDYDDNAVASGDSKIHLTVLKFSATPTSGYVLDAVEISDGTNTTTIAAADLATTTHTLTSAITINPVWRATTSTVTVTATAINGTVTGGGVVEEGTSVTLAATADAGYQFKNWTVAGTEVSTANPYTFTANEDVTVTANFEETPKVTVYFVNNSGWTKIQAYAWGDKGSNASWAGVDITANKLSEQIGGFDVYSYTVEQGLYANVIFNNGSAQTKDYVWTDGNYYWNNEALNFEGGSKADAETKFSVPVEYDYVYFINTNSWAAVNIYTWDSEIATWPGVAMNKEAEQIAGFDVYSHKEVKGTSFGGMKFNEGKDKKETGNLIWQAGKYYAPSKDKWYDTKEAAAEALAVPVVTYDYYIVGSMNSWNQSSEDYGMSDEDEDGIYEKTLTLKNNDEFKVKGSAWYGFDAIEGTYKETSSVGDKNIKVTFTTDTEVTVKFNSETKKITFDGLTEIEDYYTVVGVAELFGTAWDRANETNKMAKQGDGSYKLVKENVTLAAIGYDWKIAKNGNWWDDAAIGVNPAEGKNNTLTITTAGRYNVTFTLAADFTTATVETELLEAAVVIPDCFISGNKNLTGEETEWQGNEFTMVYDEETETWSYTLAGLQPEKEYALKVVCGGTWYSFANLTSVPAGVAEGNDNAIAFKMAEAGDVTVTYNVEAGITISGNFYEAVKYDYYITGCEKLGANWVENVEAFGMTDENEDKTYEKALTLAAGEYYLKVTDGTWTEGKNWGSAALSGKYTEITDSEGNIKITLTEEKTFTVKFDSETMKISFDGLTPDETPTKYYIVGSFNEWNTTDPNYELILDGEVYKKEVTFAKDVQFKVCDGTWAHSWGKDNLGGKLYNELTEDGDNIKMTEAKTFTIIFDLANNLITFDGLTEKAPAVVTYVLMGVNNDWTTGIALTQNPDNADEYVLENQVIIKATDAIKVVTLEDGVAKAWCGNVDSYSNATYTGGGEDNIVLEDGIYTFYFKKTDNKIYINQTGYARTATPGSFSTICLPYAGTISGATLFNLSDRDANYVYVVEAGTELEAGKPYVILPTEDKIAVTYKNYDYVAAGSYNALYGTYEEMDSDDLDGKYVITGNKYYYVDKVQSAGSTLLANRAYFKLDELQEVAPVLPVGARRIALGTNGQNTATGMENVDASAQPVKTIINGQLYILRGEKMYDAQGKLVK